MSDPTAVDVAVRPLERDFRLATSEVRHIAFEVTNRSTVTWPAHGEVRAAYRWRHPDGRLLDGHRTLFPVDVHPGETTTVALRVEAPDRPGTPDLVVDVVHEQVRWLGADLAIRVRVEERRLPTHRRACLPPGPPIPRVIHHVWLGGRPLPEAHARFRETWRRHNPDWEHRLWTDADAPAPPGVERARNVAERADLVRYEILRRHGGVYADTDVECLRPIEPLVGRTRAFAGYEVPGRLCNAVMGGAAGHRAFERLVRLAATTVGTGIYPYATATTFLTRVLEPDPEATLFPPETFYPYLWDEPRPRRTLFPSSHAVHHWAVSWLEETPA